MKNFFLWGKRLLAAVVVLFLLYQFWVLGCLLWWKMSNPGNTSFMNIRLGEMRQKQPNAYLQQEWVPYARISRNLKAALIAAEDGKFRDHHGFDWDGIQKAVEKNQKKGRFVAGGSTISQQLAKNLFLSPNRSLFRKGEEVAITVMMETVMDKQRIFEIYLNVIEWGNGIFGAEAAAKHYFGIHASQLDAYQAAKLAAMVPAPRFYDRNRNTPGLQKKAEVILARMPGAAVP